MGCNTVLLGGTSTFRMNISTQSSWRKIRHEKGTETFGKLKSNATALSLLTCIFTDILKIYYICYMFDNSLDCLRCIQYVYGLRDRLISS
jgi:hypothetical protein